MIKFGKLDYKTCNIKSASYLDVNDVTLLVDAHVC